MAEVDISGVTLAAIREPQRCIARKRAPHSSVALTSPRIAETLTGADVFFEIGVF